MFIIFDTETTGFPSTKVASTHPSQARVVQLAAVVLDENFKEISSLCEYIKPSGWSISEGAYKAHGISMDTCEEKGKPISEVLEKFFLMALPCSYMVCHNTRFDVTMLNIEFDNTWPPCAEVAPVAHWLNNVGTMCTMSAATPVCKLPFATRKNAKVDKQEARFKFPKLEEAYKHFFDEELTGAHDALVDVRATARLFEALCKGRHFASIYSRS